MGRRTYDQFCGLAHALDLVGERWTLLIVRDLSLGPQRFTDVQGGLPGIGTGLLTERLRHLEALGVVQRSQLPPPANVPVYELTDEGRELATAMAPLAMWGTRRLSELEGEDANLMFRAEWLLVSLREVFDTDAARGVHDVYEFQIDDQTIHVLVDDGEIVTRRGPAPVRPDFVVRTDPRTFMAIGMGEITPNEAAAAGRTSFEGSIDALLRCQAVFGVPTGAPVPAPVS